MRLLPVLLLGAWRGRLCSASWRSPALLAGDVDAMGEVLTSCTLFLVILAVIP